MTDAPAGCAACRHFDPEAKALASGVRYCRLLFIWARPDDGQDCPDHQQETTDGETA